MPADSDVKQAGAVSPNAQSPRSLNLNFTTKFDGIDGTANPMSRDVGVPDDVPGVNPPPAAPKTAAGDPGRMVVSFNKLPPSLGASDPGAQRPEALTRQSQWSPAKVSPLLTSPTRARGRAGGTKPVSHGSAPIGIAEIQELQATVWRVVAWRHGSDPISCGLPGPT